MCVFSCIVICINILYFFSYINLIYLFVCHGNVDAQFPMKQLKGNDLHGMKLSGIEKNLMESLSLSLSLCVSLSEIQNVC